MIAATKTLGDRLGTLRFWQQLGQPYADLVREALKPASMVTFVSSWLGAGKGVAVLCGVVTVIGLIVGAVTLGYFVVRLRVVHSHLTNDWKNDPWKLRQEELLQEIVRNGKSVPIVGLMRERA